MKIILASQSPRRKEMVDELLSKYEMDFEVEPSDVSEEELKETITEPDKLVEELSFIKASNIYEKHKEDGNDLVIIGADTIVNFENQILGKPKTVEEAKEMLTMLQGTFNDVYTGMTVIIKKGTLETMFKVNTVSRVYMKKMSENDILEYIETEDPLDKAGSYAIQGLGSKYIEKYEGDYNTVVGLDTGKLEKILKVNRILEI